MARRARRVAVEAVTPAEIAEAVRALGIDVPVRAAERRGGDVVLYTRAGTFVYTPPSGAGGKSVPAKGQKE